MNVKKISKDLFKMYILDVWMMNKKFIKGSAFYKSEFR